MEKNSAAMALGKKGGESTRIKYGREHFVLLAKRKAELARKKKENLKWNPTLGSLITDKSLLSSSEDYVFFEDKTKEPNKINMKKRKIKKQVVKEVKREYRKNKKLSEFEGREFVREKIRIRDNHTCQICFKKWEDGTRRFDVHHKDCDKDKTKQYDNLSKEEPNLITLCHKCHLNIPEHKNKMKRSH